jgi:hypothetical protein
VEEEQEMRAIAQSIKKWVRILFFTMPMVIVSMRHQSSIAFAESQEPQNVSMVALLANVQNFDGKLILTQGFLLIKPDMDTLYLHEEDYRYGLDKNGFVLDIPENQRYKLKELNLKYVLIVGIMHSKNPDAVYRCSGTIVNITRLQAWGQP